jgi:hypothetical protein
MKQISSLELLKAARKNVIRAVVQHEAAMAGYRVAAEEWVKQRYENATGKYLSLGDVVEIEFSDGIAKMIYEGCEVWSHYARGKVKIKLRRFNCRGKPCKTFSSYNLPVATHFVRTRKKAN